MAEEKNKHFKTAEQKHKETVMLKCKVCGQKMQGKSTLSRHISHAHDEMDPADREKLVIDAYYGKDVVDRTIRKFKEGEYKDKELPIDIGKYLRLAKIKPRDEEENKKHNDEDSYDEDPLNIDYDSGKQLVQVRDLAEKETHDYKKDEEVFYVEDLKVNEEDNEIDISLTKGETSALDYRLILKFIEDNDLSKSILFVSSSGALYPVDSIDVKEDDEVTGNQIKCVVAYDSTKSAKE